MCTIYTIITMCTIYMIYRIYNVYNVDNIYNVYKIHNTKKYNYLQGPTDTQHHTHPTTYLYPPNCWHDIYNTNINSN